MHFLNVTFFKPEPTFKCAKLIAKTKLECNWKRTIPSKPKFKLRYHILSISCRNSTTQVTNPVPEFISGNPNTLYIRCILINVQIKVYSVIWGIFLMRQYKEIKLYQNVLYIMNYIYRTESFPRRRVIIKKVLQL